MKSKLEQLATTLEGSILCIGISHSSFFAVLEENEHITFFRELNNRNIKGEEKEKKTKDKIIRTNQFRNTFHKNGYDILVCHYQHIKEELDTVIKDSIYIIKKTIYLYGIMKEEEVEKLIRMYQPYQVVLNHEKIKHEYFFTIDLSGKKQNHLLDAKNHIKEQMYQIGNTISDLLIGTKE